MAKFKHLFMDKMMIKLQHILHQLPDYIFWKDKALNYLGANDNLLKSAGLNSPDEIIGKNDYQLPWKLFAEKYRSDDQHIIHINQALHFEEYHKDISGQITLAIVNKKPLYDETGQILGVIGVYSKIKLKTTELNNAYLPKRQKEVLSALAKGLSAKQIALKLGISPRTVEYYIDIIKSKLGCLNKVELIKTAISFGYVDHQS